MAGLLTWLGETYSLNVGLGLKFPGFVTEEARFKKKIENNNCFSNIQVTDSAALKEMLSAMLWKKGYEKTTLVAQKYDPHVCCIDPEHQTSHALGWPSLRL